MNGPARPDYAAALATALDGLGPLRRVERVGLAEAGGRVLAEAVTADRDLPPFDRAQMDGYALRASEVGGQASWPVAARIAAGQPADVEVGPGSCAAVATGAPVPAGLDAIIQHELSDRGDPVRFTIHAIEAGHAVHPRGADARAGDVLVAAGTVLAAHHAGIAASVGATTLAVHARPRAAVITSGDEVLPPDRTPAAHQIRNSNAPMLVPLLARMGADVTAARHVPDEPAPTRAAVAAALDEADLVVTVGGISAGERD
ncbi:MAG: molybdopterin molybdotransferase MoeA, partial [Planctomycetota bacterium]